MDGSLYNDFEYYPGARGENFRVSVYNAGNPIAAGYAAGLTNPYSTDGVRALAAELK